MSEADKLFEELGYIKQKLSEKDKRDFNELYISVCGEELEQIRFWYDQTVSKANSRFEEAYITMQELKAINIKCKELGWIE